MVLINLLLLFLFQFPASEDDWKKVDADFEEMWNFPNLLYAVDGKHVDIVAPPNSGLYFFNYKGSHSMVLMAIANTRHEFLLCDFEVHGRVSYRGVIKETLIYENTCADELHIPPPKRPKDFPDALPYVFIGDEAFAVRKDF